MKKVKSGYFTKANRFIFSNKDFYQNRYNFSLKKIREDSYNQIEKFEKKSDIIMTEYQNLKEESENFLKGYNQLENKGYEDEVYKQQKKVLPFMKLITIYKINGYKVPNLSTKNNLFKPNLLFLDINEIKKHIMFNRFGKREKKELNYLNKLNTCVKEMKRESIRKNRKNNVNTSPSHKLLKYKNSFSVINLHKNKRSDSLFILNKNDFIENKIDNLNLFNKQEILDSQKIKKEEKELKEYNEKLKTMISNIKPIKKISRRKSMISFYRKPEYIKRNKLISFQKQESLNQTGMIHFKRRKFKPSSLISHKKPDFNMKNISKLNILTRNNHTPDFFNDITNNSTTLTQPSIFGKDISVTQLIEPNGDLNDCMKVMRTTQKIINNYDFNNFRRMVMSRNMTEDKENQIINSIKSLDKKINHLDKDIVYQIEKFKSSLE